MAENSKIEWFEIPSCPGYFVDREGNIGSQWKRIGLGRGKGTRVERTNAIHLLRASINQHGYRFLNLGRGNTRTVHRLVLETFVGQCPAGMEARHLNGDPSDNRLENLAWGTPKENQSDQYRHGTRVASDRHPQSKLTPLQVRAARTLADAHWHQGDIAALFGVTQPTVSSLVNRKHRVTDQREAI